MNTSSWNPKFLCDSIKGPVILSDGRVTTCTLDHEGQNELGNIYEHDFEAIVRRYGETRMTAMADPVSKPMCYKCYTKLTRWKIRKVPRAEWINKGCTSFSKESFLQVFDPTGIRINLELSSRCNLKCIGCSVARPEFKHARNASTLDFEKLKKWVGGNGHKISHVRLYHMGETWLHPQWYEICKFLKEENPKISLFTSTNGMPMKGGDTIRKAIDAKIDHIMFSIHGAFQSSVEKYMGAGFKLETALAVAKELAAGRDQHRAKPYLSWKYLIFTWNDSPEEIAEAKRLADDAGFDEINFSITSQPSPSKRFAKDTKDWLALKKECASLWSRGGDYANVAPMSAVYPGRRQREHHAKMLAEGKAASVCSTPGTLLERGVTSVMEGRPAEGIELLEKGLAGESEPTANVYFRLGEAHLTLRNHDKALGYFDRAIQLQGDKASEFLLLARARALRGLGNWEEAYPAYEAALQRRLQEGERSYGEDIYLELAACLGKLGNQEGAKTAYRLWKETYYIIHNKPALSVYCPIPKNACSYLKTAFAQNSLLSEEFKRYPGSVHEFLREPTNNCRLRNAAFLTHEKYFSFVVLRNPFDRIASAFSNLMIRPLRWHALPDPSARRAVLEIQRAKGGLPDAARSATFEELIRYLARTEDEEIDYHFRPQRSFYGRLDDFDFVGKFEDMAEVRSILSQKLKWSFEAVGEFNRTEYSGDSTPGAYSRTSPQALQKMGIYPRPEALYTNELKELVLERFADDFAAYEQAFSVRAEQPKSSAPVTYQSTPAEVVTEPLYPTGGALAYQLDLRGVVTPESYEHAIYQAFERQKAGESTRIVLAPGIYRSSVAIRPADSLATVVIEAQEPGKAIIRGSDLITGWKAENGIWHTEWPHDWGLGNAPDSYGDPYLVTPELMRRREIIFVDGVLQRQVLHGADLEPGSFWIDGANREVRLQPFIRDARPEEAVIEAGIRSTLFDLNGRQNVTFKGLRFEHDASFFFTPQRGALQLTNCRNVIVEDCVFEWNNNKGLQITGGNSAGIILRRVQASHNGCLGILASRVQGFFLEDCETSFNNWRGAWAGKYRGSPCGIKIMYGREVRLLRHRAIRNLATGIWLDEDNCNVTLQDCTVYGNYRGVHVEACTGPILLENNSVCANREEPVGLEFRWSFGSGVVITHSADVTLRNNFVADNDTAQIGVRDDRETRTITEPGSGKKQIWRAERLSLESNTIIAGGTRNKLVQIPCEQFDSGLFLRSFRAVGNRYVTSEEKCFRSGSYRAANNRTLTYKEWLGFTKQDEGSSHESI